MKSYSADALVLRTYRYGEADRIVVFLTADRGKKRGVAKNASKSRRRFGAALEPLTRGTVTYVEREHRELVRLDRIEPKMSPMGARDLQVPGAMDASRFAHVAYFAELLSEWAQEDQGNERLFRLGTSVGEAIGLGGSIEALARYFEYWLLRLEGVYPAIDVCGRCGERGLGDGAVLATSDWRYVCRPCSPRGPQLSRAAMTFLKAAGTRTPAEITAADIGAGALGEIEHVHHQLIAMHLEKEVRSARVVKEMRSHA
jgi:DNA repair protein RecO (recombination protein O)